MTELRKKLERVVSRTHRKLIAGDQIMPVRTHEGIRVGDVLIKSDENLKNLWLNEKIVYEGIYLNKAAIKIANILAKSRYPTRVTDDIKAADLNYGRLLVKSQEFQIRLEQARKANDTFRIDMYVARYGHTKALANRAKSFVLQMIES